MKTRAIILLVGMIILLVGLNRCNREVPNLSNVSLADNESSKVLVKDRKVTVIHRNKDGTTRTETKYVPSDVSIITDSRGVTHVKVKQIGFMFEPGLTLATYDGSFGAGPSIKFAYYKRMGICAGNITVMKGGKLNLDNVVNPYVGISYDLPFRFSTNTSVLVGYGFMDKQPLVGLRVRF